MPESYEDESAQRLTMTEDALLELLGADLAGPQAMPLRPRELVDRAKRWLTAQQGFLKDNICTNPSVREFVTQSDSNAAIVVEVAKLLAGLVLPVNPITLAALLAKRGLRALCSSCWEPQS